MNRYWGTNFGLKFVKLPSIPAPHSQSELSYRYKALCRNVKQGESNPISYINSLPGVLKPTTDH